MPSKKLVINNIDSVFTFSDYDADQETLKESLGEATWKHFSSAGDFIDALGSPWPNLIVAREYSKHHRIDMVALIENLGFPLERVLLLGEGECPLRIKKMLVMKNVADYLSLPLNPQELKAKVEIYRHTGNQKTQQRVSILEEVLYNDLTHTEFKILKVFLESKDWATDKKFIHDRAFHGRSLSSKAIDVHLSNLKKKLAKHDFELVHIGLKSYQIKAINTNDDSKSVPGSMRVSNA